jgi:uncharacterized protein (TIGR02646 family)
MFSFAKTARDFPELTEQQAYDSDDIYQQLIEDSAEKCYLCGDKLNAKDYQVEHFVPHENSSHVEVKFDWHNLFLSCVYCNSKKSSTYNKIGADKAILNPSEDNIGDEILHFYDPLDLTGNVVVLSSIGTSEKAANTIELLEKIYNLHGVGKPSFKMKRECNELKKAIKNALLEFRSLIKDLADAQMPSEKANAARQIAILLEKPSAFTEFKYGMIAQTNTIKNLLLAEQIDC